MINSSMAVEQDMTATEQIPTTFGEFSLVEGRIVNLINGLPGFEHLKRFTIAELADFAPFSAMISLEEPEISMLLVHARHLAVWNSVGVDPRELSAIGAGPGADLDIWVILRTDPETHAFTANVKAPLFVNRETNSGDQIILDDSRLSVDYPLSEGLI